MPGQSLNTRKPLASSIGSALTQLITLCEIESETIICNETDSAAALGGGQAEVDSEVISTATNIHTEPATLVDAFEDAIDK